jgi:hypothetical protein
LGTFTTIMATARNLYKLLFALLLIAGGGFFLKARHHHHRQQHPALVAHHVYKHDNKQSRHSFDPALPTTAYRVETHWRPGTTPIATPSGNLLSPALPATSSRGPPAAA